jgi:hypothetical protein
MPTVERLSGPSVSEQGLPGAYPNARLDPNFANGLIRGVGDLGEAVMGIAQKEQDKADTAQVLEAQRKLGDWERTWFDPSNPTSVPNRKGRDALGLVDEVAPDFDRVATELAGGLKSERAQQAFAQHLAVRRESLLDRINGHAVSEYDAYVDNEFKAALLNNTDLAAQAALEGRFDDQHRLVAEGLRTIYSQAKLRGQPPELTQTQEREFVSSVHATAVNGMLARGDVDGAATYFHDNADQISAQTAGELTARLRPQLIDAAAYKILDGMDYGVDPVGDLGAGIGVQALWAGVEHQESRGQQDAVSPKGAVGVAQIMPGTGPQAAQYAQLPWDPERFKNDADYNRKLGQAYLGAQLTTFQIPALALAAYNAGPGRVQEWLAKYGDPRKGEVSVAEWVSRVPYPETKKYVTTILGRVAPAAGGGVTTPPPVTSVSQPPAEPTLASELARVKGATPELRARLEAGIRQRWNDRKAAERDAELETEKALFFTVNTTTDLTTPLRQQLPPEQYTYAAQHNQLEALEAQMARRRAGIPAETPPDEKLALQDVMHRAALGDPVAAGYVMKLNPYDPKAPRAPADRDAIAALQLALRKGDKSKLQAAATDGEVSNVITQAALRGFGITREQLKTDERARDKFNQFDRNMRTFVSTWAADHGGKKPSYVELQAAADHMLMKAPAVNREGWDSEEPTTVYSIRRSDQVPERALVRITTRLKAAGMPVTDETVSRYYRDAARMGLVEELLK